MSSMIRPESVLTFGKYKGKTARDAFVENPSYFYWLRETGFGSLGKDLTEAVMKWEEENPAEAKKVRVNIAKKKAQEQANEKAFEDSLPTHDPLPPAKPRVEYGAAWGSW